MFLSVLFTLNLLLFLFNLLPVPPLDGQAAIGLFMKEDMARRWNEISRSSGFAIVGLLVAWVIFGRVFGTVFVLALNALYPGAGYGYS
jgi:Zn-dependent protease